MLRARPTLPGPLGRSTSPSGEQDRVRTLVSIAYVVIGVIVASQHSYYTHLTTVSQVVSAVVATVLWPLILVGANLHLNLGKL
jgi:membrane protein YdbS with pleckstrin-like domain